MKLFLSPHNDDAALFGAFTILRERPFVVPVFDSYVQAARGTGITKAQRRAEDEAAMEILGAPLWFLGLSDMNPNAASVERELKSLPRRLSPEMVYAPLPEVYGHPHHNLVGEVAKRVFPNVTFYCTYTTAGKSRGTAVPYEPEWPLLKLKALACYESQIGLANTAEHFLRDQFEYYAP